MHEAFGEPHDVPPILQGQINKKILEYGEQKVPTWDEESKGWRRSSRMNTIFLVVGIICLGLGVNGQRREYGEMNHSDGFESGYASGYEDGFVEGHRRGADD